MLLHSYVIELGALEDRDTKVTIILSTPNQIVLLIPRSELIF